MWSKDFFDSITEKFFLINNIEEDVISFFKQNGLNFNSRVLEQCCGIGTLSNTLSTKLNSRFTGMDIIPEYIEKALEENKKIQKLNKFIVEDISQANFFGLFHFVINFNTSCNYFKEDEKNEMFFKHAFKNLKNNGIYFIDFYNSNFVEKNFKEFREEKYIIDGKDYLIEKKSKIIDKMLITEVFIFDENKNLIKKSIGETKMYTNFELEDMLLKVGFTQINKYSNFKMEPFNIDTSSKLLIIAKK